MLGTGALAGEGRAGANSYSESKMKNDIEEARENADVVVVDFQFQECYSYPPSNVIYPICYKPLASPDQKGTFRKAVEFGADIVIGTQAHQPQTYEIYEGKLIFYGLGNLYFDQVYWIGTMHGLVLTHYMHNGKLIQTRLTTTNYGNDMQTYVSTGEERKLLLELLRDAR
jgi:poly-gamma-glutamate synthesis protein (capsule biosynthesis protein)